MKVNFGSFNGFLDVAPLMLICLSNFEDPKSQLQIRRVLEFLKLYEEIEFKEIKGDNPYQKIVQELRVHIDRVTIMLKDQKVL